MASYEKIEDVVPGIHLAKFAKSKFIYCRIYNKETQQYLNRSTGKESIPEARAYVMDNLQSLFQIHPAQRGGGSNSITRLLSQHVDYLRQRQEAGEIAEGTFVAYDKAARHFMKWFVTNKFKKLNDIQRSSLLHYGINRVNDDEMSPNTVNLEVVYIRMFWRWLQDEEIINRPLRVNSVQKAVEKRVGSEPFAPGDLKLIYKTTKEWVKEESKSNFGNRRIESYNKELFLLFLKLLDESGARQHEVWNRSWKEVSIGETLTNRKRIINTVAIPQSAKRGARQTVFRGDSLIEMKRLAQRKCVNFSETDYLFRSEQTNTLMDISTFARYWSMIREKCGLKYKLHTFRSHRITQLIMGGVEAQLVARNLGLSLAQIEKSYLRYAPAGHFNVLVQSEIPADNELRSLMI